MAGAVVSASKGVMDSVLVKLNDLVSDTRANLIGVSKDIIFLKEELPAMNALLEKLDDTDELDPQVKNWRNQVREMTYDIEDCIDDFKSNTGSMDANDSLFAKVSNFVKILRARFDTAIQIKELKARLQDINDRRKRYKVDDCTSNTTMMETIDPRLPALYNEADSLVGIENPKEELVRWVLDEDQKLKVVSIVGTGGLGKTTLAKEVYCEAGGERGLVETTHARRFTCKAFISISRTPNWTLILENMLSQLGGNLTGAYDMQSFIDSHRQYLHDKRYLIVVDDLWSVKDWNNIRCAFPQNNAQSRVLVTTRDLEVARACCSDHQYIHYMQPLNDANSRSLFLKRISISDDDPHFKNSEEVLCEILKKCGGLPLAIITIASILACQEPGRLKENWGFIQNSLAIQSATNPTLEIMMQILDLSYRSLPHYLKSCFLYLGKYPEDHIIGRVELVRQWVAEGFVRSHSDLDVWDIAEGYFNGLVNRSMIQPIYNKLNTEVSYCRVHDMMLELILRRCGEDNFITVVRDPQEVAEAQYKVRRLSINMNGTKDVSMSVATTNLLSQVRSLAMFGGTDWIPPLLEFKYIRVLFLEFQRPKRRTVLTCINQLSQLRYLKIEQKLGKQMIELPSQIQRLQHLETLEFPGNSRDFPSSIVELPRLSHLIVPGNTRLPEGIGKLKSLRTLNGFCLHKCSSENISALGALTNLVDLTLSFSEMVIFGEKGRCSGDANSGCMLNKTCEAISSALEKLGCLKWICLLSAQECHGDVLFSLSPPFHKLERLVMCNVTFPRVPKWIDGLLDLRRLHLRVTVISNSSWEDVGIIGTLPSLIDLSLQVAGIPAERILITGFPALQEFRFDCDGISHLSFEAGAMPNLRKLELIFDPHKWNKDAPAGLEHLASLKEITAAKVRYTEVSSGEAVNMEDLLNKKEVEKTMDVLIRGVLQEAAEALPTRPAFTFQENTWCWCRPYHEHAAS